MILESWEKRGVPSAFLLSSHTKAGRMGVPSRSTQTQVLRMAVRETASTRAHRSGSFSFSVRAASQSLP